MKRKSTKKSFSHTCKKTGDNKFEISWIQFVTIAKGETVPVKYVKKTSRANAQKFCTKHSLFFHDRPVIKENKSQRRRRYYLHTLMSKTFSVNAHTKTITVTDLDAPILKKYGAELVKLGYNLQTSLI